MLALVVAACVPGAAIAFDSSQPPPTVRTSGADLQSVESLALEAPFAKAPDQGPEALSAAAASHTAFAHLSRDQAIALADKSFHLDHPSWTPPGKDDGAHISKYLDEHSAQETLPNGKRTVIASTTPLRVEGRAGLAPVDLTLHEEGGTFVPSNPLVPVTISKSTGSVAFPSGVSVAPVANGPEGATTAGNSVVLANSAPDTDFIAEPVPQGAELSWQLRSQESPESDALNLNLPPGASLRLSSTMAGAAEVLAEGKRLLLIPPAVSTDAAGRSIPTSYSVSGSTLTTHADLSGTVTFPVMVDPLFIGDYGTANGASNWGSWTHADSCGGCFASLIFYNLIQIGTNPGPAEGQFGEWYTYAPGWAAGGSGIARVDLQEVIHEAAGQSVIQAGLQGGGVGPNPVYSFNGFAGASGQSPLNTTTSYTGIPIAFCAQGAGGTDGGAQPLCDENYWGADFYIADILGPNARTVFNYIRVGGAIVTYLDTTPPVIASFNQGKAGWVQYGPANATISASDNGLGIKHFQLELPAGSSPYFSQNISCNSPNGFVGCPQFETSQPINLSGLGNGVYEVGAVAEDAAGNATRLSPYPKLYIDHTNPSLPALTGTLAEASGSTIGNGNYTLKFSAEDGVAGAPQSGPEQIRVLVDGRVAYTAKTTCPLPTGIPSSACFSLAGEWTFNGQTWGAGAHHVTVVAKDFAGNTETRALNVTVNEAENQPVGPGTVNLQTGNYKLSATDVSIASANAALGLTRSYDSRSLEQGTPGPLGPQWSLSVPSGASTGWQSLAPLPEGAVSVYTGEGEQLIFSPKAGGGWEPPAGYQTDKLTEPSTSPAVYQVTDADGNYTKFTQAGTETRFTPSSVAQVIGAGGLNKVSYAFTKTAQGVVEPTKILAPEPSEGACATTLVKGCRTLTFGYASSTTATGEGKSAWGNYSGRLSQVKFTAWDPSKGEMTTTAVAEYSYDAQGRMRAEWDPRISPALKTTYGYDAAGHVTALTPPGQEGWAFHYGAITGDANEGRLLSVARPSAGTTLWNGTLPSSTAAPALSGAAKVGVKMTVNNGTWSNGPIAYGYQWFDCDYEGAHCSLIAGATNPSFTVRSNDQQYTLVAQVSATNGGGTVVASAPHSALVTTGTGTEGAAPPAPEARSTIEYRLPLSGTGLPEMTSTKVATWGQEDRPVEATAIFPPDKPQSWPASEYKRASIYYLDAQNRTVNVASPTGGISTSEYDSHNDVTRSLSSDNRAMAIAAGAKSLETAQALETKSEYSTDGTELVGVLGPQHNVKLAGGAEVLARKHTRYYYDEGAPGSGGPYRLVTKTTEGAQLSSGEERDVRVTKSSYSGQEGLGWKLHAPTVSEADPGNLDLIHKVKYDSQTGNVLEDSSPGASSETIYPPVFSASFGSEGSGNGQLQEPTGVATDAAGNNWVVDSGNGRVEKFSASGSFIATYGTKGTGNLQFKGPWGIAVNQSSGNVYVADEQNNRIEELSSAGAYIASLGTSGPGTLAAPTGVAVDATGDVWVADQGHSRIVEFNPEGSYIREAGGAGSGSGQLKNPDGLVLSEGSLFVLDTGDSRVAQFSPSGSYLGQIGSKGSGSGQFNEPAGIAVNASTGNLYVADPANARIEEFSPAGRFLTQWGTASPSHPPNTPVGLAVGATGRLLISDPFGDKVSTWTPPEAGAAHLAYASQFGSIGSGSGQFSSPDAMAIDGEGHEWVTDFGNNRIEEFTSKGIFISAFGTKGTGNGQFNGPEGIDINQSTGNVYVADSGNRRIEELSSTGTFIAAFGSTGSGELQYPGGLRIDSAGNVWAADIAASRIVEFSAAGTFIAAYGKEGSGEVQFKEPGALAFSGENVYVADSGNHRVQELTKMGAFIRQFGINGQGSGELEKPEGIGTDAAGNLYVADLHGNHVEEFNASGGYLATFGSSGTGEGQMTHPSAVSIDAGGNLYVVDSADARVEKWTRANQAAHTTKTIYYTSSANSEYPSCGGHAEWAGLPCQAQPAQQPQAFGLQKLPVTTYAYNVWDEPVTTTDAVGSTTRTTTIGYDAAGRTQTNAISSSIDTPVPATTFKYDSATGLLVEESTSTKALKSAYNTLGELETYTDADGNVSTFSYDVDGRTEKTSDGKGTQSFTYDSTSGLPELLKDSAAGSFTPSFDVEGNMIAEGYPNGMSAKYTLTSTGQPTNLEYVKTTHCSSSCVWYSDQVVPSVHDQWLAQTSSLSKEGYAYDGVGRLTEAQETPAGKGCTSRVYALDEDGNRTTLTTRPPGAEGKCSTEGGTTERHLYDEGDRLADEGVSYEAFGNTTALPGVDAGGAPLTSTFYTNNSLASETQSGQAISYVLDPAGRTREAVKTGTLNESITSHYTGETDSPAWTVTSGGAWTRYIPAFSGLAAIQTSSGTVELELTNLHGDIVAKASPSETETKMLSATDTTEYGVPTVGTPARYSWMGNEQRPTELSSGMIAMGARGYIPQLGRFEQSDPQPGGSGDAYSYTGGDPVNTSDPSGAFTNTVTYDYEAASAGAAESGLAEHWIAPGALMPPPVDLQIEAEFNAHPPWTAVSVLESGGFTPGFLRNLTDPVRGEGELSQCNRSGQHCSGCRSGGKRNKHGQCEKGPDTGNGGVQKALVKCLLGGGGGALVDKTTPAGAAIGCAISFLPTP
jgi:tripartite motif-containing protein 71